MVSGDTARKLPRRDLVLLPALVLLTAVVLLTVSEVAAHLIWQAQEVDRCRVDDEVSGLPHFLPLCTSRDKVPEGPWVDNRYNDCGYRTRQSCLIQPAGLRVAVLGTSFSYGYMTPYEDAFTTLTANALSEVCGKPVEFQNLGFPNYTLVDIYQRLDEALRLHPDVILLAINPIDVRKEITPQILERRNDAKRLPKRTEPPVQGGWLKTAIIAPLRESRAVYVAQHFLFQDPETYLNLYLLYGDSAGYLATQWSDKWQQRLHTLDVILADMAARAAAASTPIMILLGPQPSQVALLNSPHRENFDAYAFTKAVRSVADKYNIIVIDPLPAMAEHSNSMSLFYVVDGHLAKSGQQIVAQQLERGLLGAHYPALASCSEPARSLSP